MRIIYSVFILFSCHLTLAQNGTDSLLNIGYSDFGGVVLMDSIVVKATKSGFDVEDFIKMVREDKSFYQSFRNIRTLSYSAENEIIMFSKKGKEKAKYFSKTKQRFEDRCRSMTFENEQIRGNYFKNKKKRKLRYYTAKMFEQLFFTRGKVCIEHGKPQVTNPPKGMAKHIAELKKLIFSPGEKADVAIIGKKTEIFSDRMAKYYDFSIRSERYNHSTDCYVFSAVIKPEYQEKKKDKTVIKSLHTYFEKSNFQVIARTYNLFYYGALFDFNVDMRIELKQVGDQYVPEYLEYNGFWDIPTRKPEISKFYARFYDYESMRE